MEIPNIPQTVNQVSENSDSSVTIELGKAGAIEIRVKAGRDCIDQGTASPIDGLDLRMSYLKDQALGTFRSLYNSDVIAPHIKTLKKEVA